MLFVGNSLLDWHEFLAAAASRLFVAWKVSTSANKTHRASWHRCDSFFAV